MNWIKHYESWSADEFKEIDNKEFNRLVTNSKKVAFSEEEIKYFQLQFRRKRRFSQLKYSTFDDDLDSNFEKAIINRNDKFPDYALVENCQWIQFSDFSRNTFIYIIIIKLDDDWFLVDTYENDPSRDDYYDDDDWLNQDEDDEDEEEEDDEEQLYFLCNEMDGLRQCFEHVYKFWREG